MLILNLKNKRQAVAAILPISMVLLLVFLRCTQFFITHRHDLSIAITLDLVFSIPLIHFVLSNRTNNSKYSTALFFTVGLIVASYIVPENNQSLLHEIKFAVVPVVESCGIIFFVIQTRKIRAKQAALKISNEDFYTVFKKVSRE